MEQHQVPGTRVWMAAFLALALTMIVAALAWSAFGPPIL
jgi:type II secretory pathway component PulK